MLENMDILPFSLKDEKGGKIEAEKLTAGHANILFWLEEGKEPTEHILNELIEHHERYNKLDAQLIFILRSEQAKQNPHPLQRHCELLPNCPSICYDDFRDNVRTPLLPRRNVCRSGQACPLIIVTKPGLNGIFATSGYNVGMGDC